MSLYTRARRHIDMDRVKELREEKIKREQIAEILRQQEKIRAELEYIEAEELKYINWRSELEEGMNTSGMGMINLPGQGDVNLGAAMSDISLSGDGGEGGYNAITRDSTSSYKQFDTMVVSLTTSSSDWVISPGAFIQTLASGGSGSRTIVIPKSYSSLYFSAKDDGTFSASVQYQRRAPVNVFVPLDDPEANSFIRGGLGGDKNKEQQLKDQLEAGNKWMSKLGLDPSKTSPGDMEIAAEYPDDGWDSQDQATLEYLQSGALGGGPRIEKAINKMLENKRKYGKK